MNRKMLKKEEKHRAVVVWLILLWLLCCFGIVFFVTHSKESISTIGDIAYDRTSSEKCVYIKENEEYVPFLVLTDQYEDGKTLLLRKGVLEEPRRYNEYFAGYEGSEIDRFLNDVYYASLEEDIQPLIQNTEISITTSNSLGVSGSETKNIKRRIFLLSLEELGFDSSVNAGREGKSLKYFEDPGNRIVCKENGSAGWMLRTPNTYFSSAVYAIGANGTLDILNAYDKSGIRPAFFVDSSAKIVEKDGKYIFVTDDTETETP